MVKIVHRDGGKYMEFLIYRYDNIKNIVPKMELFELDVNTCSGVMLLDALIALREQDPTLTFRKSCGEGVCGSDAMSINGKNGLACVTLLSTLPHRVVLRPLPAMPVIRDLVVDLSNFYRQYHRVKPYLVPSNVVTYSGEMLQSKEQRDKLDGLYECILCACCTSSCISYWWNPDKFLGPAASLQGARFIHDSRDSITEERLALLCDTYSIFRCRGIMNCTNVCPKGLKPADAIGSIRRKLLARGL